MRRATLLFFALAFGHPGVSEIRWAESPLWRSAQVLPQGQHRWSARAGGQVINNRFDAGGEEIALGEGFGQKWTWGDLLKAQRNKGNQDELLQYMEQNDISENDQAATSGFNIEREEINFDVSWAYGMTSRWMFGLFMPVSQVTTRVSSEVALEERSTQGFKIFAQQNHDVENVERMVENLVRGEIESQGYREIPTEREQWVWGDISLLNQYLAYSSEDLRWSLQQVLRMPTSRNPSLSEFALASRDEGQIDIGISQYLERNFGPFTGIFGAGYINQLPGPIRVSERNENGERLADDREIERDLGDLWWGGLESRYNLSSWLRLSGAYRYFYKEPDEFKFIQSIENQSQEAHLARLVASYVFSPVETRYGIEKKWLLNLQLQSTLAGNNTDQATSAALEIQTYF